MKEKKVKTPNKTADNSKVESVLENFSKPIAEPPKKKYGWISMVLLIVIIGVGIFFMVKLATTVTDSEIRSLGEILANLDVKYALIAVAALVGVMLLESAKFFTITHATTGLLKPLNSVKVAFLGKYYDGITPFSAGGQPMQIYYLHKKGISGGISSAVILIKYMVQMCVYCLVSLVFMAAGTGVVNTLAGTERTVIIVFGWIGLAVNMILPLAVLLFAVLPKFAKALASFIVGIGHKIKIVKDKEKTMAKAEAVVNDYRSGFVIMAHHPVQFILLILACVTEVLLTFSFPYFMMKTFSGLTADDGFTVLLQVMTMNIYVIQAVAIIPTPGNTGAMEGLGALAFTTFVTGSIQFWSMFGWRFAVYYVYIVVGLGITIFDFIRRLVRAKRNKKNKEDGV